MKVYVTDGETIVLEDDTSYQLVCCDCGLTHELEVRRLSPGHRTLIKIRRISESRIAELEAANAKYKSALGHIEEYWNGDYNEKAMSDACDAVVEIARQAIRED